ncbi:MAG: ATP-dependent zinc metalloprotease FtsH [Fimbriimonadales bacterium]
MNRRVSFTIFVVFIAAFLIWFLNSTNRGGILSGGSKRASITQITQDAKEGKISKVIWETDTITAEYKDGTKYYALGLLKDGPAGANLLDKFEEYGVEVSLERPLIGDGMQALLMTVLLPIGVFALLWFFLIRPAQNAGSQAMNFARSKARRVSETVPKVTFDDVAGVDEAKQELAEIVDFLKNTKKYIALGAKIPKGVLLTGPPGCGKTHLARAVAGEAGVPFFHISGSDFVEMFVGVGAARVRDLFETAKAHRPSLVFVDEIDAVGRQRGAGLGGGHDEREQTLNQLLVEMDGFDPNSGVIVIAATNRPDVLDPALLRPGRFDRHVVVDAPDAKGREAILKIHSKGKPLADGVALDVIARRTVGFTGADLANALNEAALLAARHNKTRVEMADLNEALDRVIAGPQRKSRVVDPEERKTIAVHEAGHAIVGESLEHADPVHKVTILPRGMSLGATWQLPDQDKYLISKSELMDDVTALLGGRVAEEIVFGEVTTGASNDLERVTSIARAMVCKYGMSEKLGTLALGRRHDNPFLGRDYMEDRNYSEDIARQIDGEVKEIVDNCHQRAKSILLSHREQLDSVVESLLERETLDRDDFLSILKGVKLEPQNPEGQAPVENSGEISEKSEGIPRPTLKPGTAEA